MPTVEAVIVVTPLRIFRFFAICTLLSAKGIGTTLAPDYNVARKAQVAHGHDVGLGAHPHANAVRYTAQDDRIGLSVNGGAAGPGDMHLVGVQFDSIQNYDVRRTVTSDCQRAVHNRSKHGPR